MDVWQAIVLGVVEGLTEFLPVSSTGHLLVAQRLLGIPASDAANAFSICIQAGAIVAVLAIYGGRVWQTVRGLLGKDPQGARLLLNLVVAFAPAAVIGKLLHDPIERVLFGVKPVLLAWFAGGVLILAVARRPGLRGSDEAPAEATTPQAAPPAACPECAGPLPAGAPGRCPACGGRTAPEAGAAAPPGPRPGLGLEALAPGQAAVIGLAQCLAMWPGTSRSLVTLLAGVFVGLSLPAAVEFSFLLGLMTLGAATAYEGLKHGSIMLAAYGPLPLGLGFAAATVSAFASARWMIAHLSRRGLEVFGWWRLLAAAAVGVLILTGRISP